MVLFMGCGKKCRSVREMSIYEVMSDSFVVIIMGDVGDRLRVGFLSKRRNVDGVLG